MKRIIGTIAASVLLLAVAAGPALACPPGEDEGRNQGPNDHRICKVTDLGFAEGGEQVSIVASSTDGVQGGNLVVTIERAALGDNSQNLAPKTVVATNVNGERTFFITIPDWRKGAVVKSFIQDASRAKAGCETVAVDVLT